VQTLTVLSLVAVLIGSGGSELRQADTLAAVSTIAAKGPTTAYRSGVVRIFTVFSLFRAT